MDDLEFKARYTEMKRKADEEFENRQKARVLERIKKETNFAMQKNAAMTNQSLKELANGSVKKILDKDNRPAELLVRGNRLNHRQVEQTTRKILKELYLERELGKGPDDNGKGGPGKSRGGMSR